MKRLHLLSSCYERLIRTCVATVLFSFLFSSPVFAQAVLSTKSISSTIASGGDIYPQGTALDASGNYYLVGWFKGTVDMDPGSGVSHLISNGAEDCFVAKYNSSGGFVWARSFGGSIQDICRDVAIDANGDVIISGYFQASADFDPGPGLSRLTSNGNNDIFFAKYTSTGDFIFARSMGGTTNDSPSSLTLDGSGNIYLTGTLTSPTVDFDPGAGESTLTKIGAVDAWLARYDNNGNYVWAFNIGTTGSSQISPTKMTLANGSLYVTGYFTGGPVDFNPGPATNALTNKGISDIFVARYDLTGAYNTAFAVGGTGYDFAYGIAADGSGNIYITGKYESVVNFNPSGTANLTSAGQGDIFLAKYSATGGYLFAKSIGSVSDEVAQTVMVDDAGNPVIGGAFAGTIDFDPGSAVVNLTSNNGSRDAFLVKFNSSGTFTWARSIGGLNSDQAYTLVKAPSGNIITVGTFQGTVDFDPGSGVVNLTAPGSLNVGYCLRLNSSGNFVSVFAPQGYAAASASQTTGATWIDADNNYYVTGGFAKTVDFDPGPGETSLTAISYQDFFLAKYNAAGELVFVKTLGNASGGLQGMGIVTDAAGNIYTAVRFQGTLDADPGPATMNISSNGSYDILLLKLSSTGNYLASAQIGGTGAEVVNALIMDNEGALYITGQFLSTVDFDPGSGTSNLTSKGSGDAFIAKYNTNFNYLFAAQFGGTGNDIGNDIAVDNAGNMYTIGNFAGTADVDPSSSVFNLTSAGINDVFVSKLDKNGNFVYGMRLGGTGNDNGNAIEVDAAGNIYTAGMFNNTVDFDPGTGTTEFTSAGLGDAFLARYDPNGNFIAAGAYGGALNDIAQKIKLDTKGNIYLAGQFSSTQLTFDRMGNTFTYNNEGDADVFLAIFKPSLVYQAGRSIGGAVTDQLGGLSLDATGNIYMAGSFGGKATIDNLTGVSSVPFQSINTRDIFMAKFAVPEILPITLEKFTATLQQSEVVAKWTVSAQVNNNYFELERSADGKQFKSIGKVSGCTNCPERMDYQFTDKQPLTGVSFYRLKQTDLDARFTYSRIVRVSYYENNGQLKLIPTATTSGFTLSFLNRSNKDLPAVVKLTNTSGAVIQSTKVILKSGLNNIPMSLLDRSSGIYYVSLIISGSSNIQTAAVIRQ